MWYGESSLESKKKVLTFPRKSHTSQRFSLSVGQENRKNTSVSCDDCSWNWNSKIDLFKNALHVLCCVVLSHRENIILRRERTKLWLIFFLISVRTQQHHWMAAQVGQPLFLTVKALRKNETDISLNNGKIRNLQWNKFMKIENYICVS